MQQMWHKRKAKRQMKNGTYYMCMQGMRTSAFPAETKAVMALPMTQQQEQQQLQQQLQSSS